ncbi:MAG: hypothetical protein ABI806_09860 [Candidatus Solibacter sp.]
MRASAVLAAAVWLAVLAPLAAFAQPTARQRDALEWTIALRGRIAQFENPVVRVHGLAGLAHLVCPLDPVAASGLYRTAITGLFNTRDGAFNERLTMALPVASFSGLWKYVVPAATECDPGLVSESQNQQARERLDNERAGANAKLGRAYGLLDNSLDKEDMQDRAAQVARGALEAGDPVTLDTALLSRILSLLNERAPDLADDLFIRSVDFVMSSKWPSPFGLQDLAKFLLTSTTMVDKDEEDQPGKNFKTGGVTVEDFSATRGSANPDNVQSLIEAVLKLSADENVEIRNSTVAYSLAHQLVPRARELMPERVADLEKAQAEIEAANPGVGASVIAGLGTPQNPDPDSGDPAARNFWLTGQIQGAIGAGEFNRARQLMARVDDQPVRGQLGSLITFAESARAIEQKSEMALALANLLRPGIKRSLLYIGMIAAATRRDDAAQVLPLASKDISPLPAEQRLHLNEALAASLVKWDPEAAFGVINLVIAAYNDVRTNPRRGRFDPASVRRAFNPRSDGASDSSLILPGNRGFYEAVQTQRGRHNFGLRVAGVRVFTLNGLLAAAGGIDPDRLSAAILAVRDETTQSAAWVTLAAMRLREK